MNLVDTSGWLEYFFAGPNVARFAKPIESTAKLLVPTICLYEVFKKINIVGNEAQALQAVAKMSEGVVLELTESIALSASLISIKHKIPMADSIIYASALANNATIWTQDIDFKTLPGVKYPKARTTN
jgi:predicted nucleic acid-binding protein